MWNNRSYSYPLWLCRAPSRQQWYISWRLFTYPGHVKSPWMFCGGYCKVDRRWAFNHQNTAYKDTWVSLSMLISLPPSEVMDISNMISLVDTCAFKDSSTVKLLQNKSSTIGVTDKRMPHFPSFISIEQYWCVLSKDISQDLLVWFLWRTQANYNP